MSPEARQFIDARVADIARINAVAKAITGSPITLEMEAIIPGLAQIVAQIEVAEEIASLLTTAVPILEGLSGVFIGLEIRPMTVEEMAARDEEANWH
jgi:hypothetical protein